MLKITIICVGNLKERYLKDACTEYIKRLHKYCNLEIVEVDEHKITKDTPSPTEISICKDKEGDKILRKIPKDSLVISLCIEGTQYSSEQFSSLISGKMVEGTGEICFVIGGSWGISDKIKSISHLRLSISKMTFPHQLARVILCEQIYRMFQIMYSGKYHK